MAGFVSNLLAKIGMVEYRQSTGPITESDLHHWLVDRLAKQLKIAPAQVNTSRAFESYGLDSIVAVQVAGDLEKLLERRLSPALLFEHQNIDDLVKYLAAELTATADA